MHRKKYRIQFFSPPFVILSYYVILVLIAALTNATQYRIAKSQFIKVHAHIRRTRFNANKTRGERNSGANRRGEMKENGQRQRRRNRKHGRVRAYFIQILLRPLIVLPFRIVFFFIEYYNCCYSTISSCAL